MAHNRTHTHTHTQTNEANKKHRIHGYEYMKSAPALTLGTYICHEQILFDTKIGLKSFPPTQYCYLGVFNRIEPLWWFLFCYFFTCGFRTRNVRPNFKDEICFSLSRLLVCVVYVSVVSIRLVVYYSALPIWLVETVWRICMGVSIKSKHDLRLRWVRFVTFIYTKYICTEFQIELKFHQLHFDWEIPFKWNQFIISI